MDNLFLSMSEIELEFLNMIDSQAISDSKKYIHSKIYLIRKKDYFSCDLRSQHWSVDEHHEGWFGGAVKSSITYNKQL